MAKFWYKLTNDKDNLTVKLSPKDSVTFSKRLNGNTKYFLEENKVLDELVAAKRLSKMSATTVLAVEKSNPVEAEEPKPAPAPVEGLVVVASEEATISDPFAEEGETEGKRKGKKK